MAMMRKELPTLWAEEQAPARPSPAPVRLDRRLPLAGVVELDGPQDSLMAPVKGSSNNAKLKMFMREAERKIQNSVGRKRRHPRGVNADAAPAVDGGGASSATDRSMDDASVVGGDLSCSSSLTNSSRRDSFSLATFDYSVAQSPRRSIRLSTDQPLLSMFQENVAAAIAVIEHEQVRLQEEAAARRAEDSEQDLEFDEWSRRIFGPEGVVVKASTMDDRMNHKHTGMEYTDLANTCIGIDFDYHSKPTRTAAFRALQGPIHLHRTRTRRAVLRRADHNPIRQVATPPPAHHALPQRKPRTVAELLPTSRVQPRDKAPNKPRPTQSTQQPFVPNSSGSPPHRLPTQVHPAALRPLGHFYTSEAAATPGRSLSPHQHQHQCAVRSVHHSHIHALAR